MKLSSSCRDHTFRNHPLGLNKFLLGIASGFILTTAASHAVSFTTIKSLGSLTDVTGSNPGSPLVQAPDGMLYGTTYNGKGSIAGTIFKVRPDGGGFTVLKFYTNYLEGANPSGLTLSNNVLYGTTDNGGLASDGTPLSGFGTVFTLNTDGTDFKVLKSFTRDDGAHPVAGVTLSGNILYGITEYGGNPGAGVIFKLNTDGTGYSVIKNFTAKTGDGGSPLTSIRISGNALYGTTDTSSGGYGMVFRINPDGTGFTILKQFNLINGASPRTLTIADGMVYGTTDYGGDYDRGTAFKMDLTGGGFTVLKSFNGASGEGNPSAGLILSNGALYGTTVANGTGQGTLYTLTTNGTDYTVLKNFAGFDGAYPNTELTISNTVLYGTTWNGGGSNVGTLFRLNTDGGAYTLLKEFTDSDAPNIVSCMTYSDGVLYGTTSSDGSSGVGTVFKVNTNGAGYTVLKDFNGGDGANPRGSLALSGNVLYGTTVDSGAAGFGTVFSISTDGTGYTVLKDFSGADGANPYGGMILSDNVLYGTASAGGAFGYGTVFKMNTNGIDYTQIKDFAATDGANPIGDLTLSDGVIYGTTYYGGSSGGGTVFRMNTDGTDFAVLKSFDYRTGEGAHPYSGVTVSGDVIYGTASSGYGSVGTVFRMNTNGTGFTVLQSVNFPYGGLTLVGNLIYGTSSGSAFRMNTNGADFVTLKKFSGTDGASPYSRMTWSGSVLYGSTALGGDFGQGTLFKIDPSAPVVLTIQSLGNAVVLRWDDPTFGLQAAPIVTGVYTNIPGAVSPYTNAVNSAQTFFRLIGN